MGLFGFFKKKKEVIPELVDLDNNLLMPGDQVEALRYDLGKCQFLEEEEGYYYESLESGEKVSWLKMIDASTERQKVRKINS